MMKFTDVIGSDLPVVVCFYTDWCPSCRRMDPIIEELASEYQGKIRFAILDATKHPQAAAKYYVRRVPAFIVFVDGSPQEMKVGTMSKWEFENWLRRYYYERD